MIVEDALDQIAGADAIDRNDERTFNTSEFSEVIFVMHLTDEDRTRWDA